MTTTLTKTKPSTKTRKTLSLPKKTASKVVEAKSAPAASAPQPVSAPLVIASPAPAPPVSAPVAGPAPVVVDESKVKTKKAKAAKPAKAPGKSVRIYEATWNHPELTAPQLAALLIAEGLESTAETIGTISSDFKRSINWLASQGLMKSPFKQ